MARTPIELPVTPSLLDRLTDEDPRNQIEAPATRPQSVRTLKAGLRRDLEWLLNSRSVAEVPDESLREVAASVHCYGLPDFANMGVSSSKDQARLLAMLHEAVRLYEPRLMSVRILPADDMETGSRTLRFRIEGLLRMDPAPEHVSFDTVLELSSGEYVVRGGGHA